MSTTESSNMPEKPILFIHAQATLSPNVLPDRPLILAFLFAITLPTFPVVPSSILIAI